jgi:predicted PurR-regulated permease PerM
VLLVLWLARGIIGPFVVAAVLAYAFSPVVSAVQEKTHALARWSSASATCSWLGLFAVLAVVSCRAGRIGDQVPVFGRPDVIATALSKVFGDPRRRRRQRPTTSRISPTQIRSSLLGLVRTPSDAIHMAEQAVDVALQAVLALIVTFYFLLDGRRFGQFALRFLDRIAAGRRAEDRLTGSTSSWVAGCAARCC